MDYTALSPEDLLIACLGTRDEGAWTEFVRQFHPLISRVVSRIARQWGETSTEVIDDLIQETYLKLCAEGSKLSQKFTPSHEGAIFGYIKVVTANLVHDHFKASRSHKRGHRVTSSLDPHGEGRKSGLCDSSVQTLERHLLIDRIDECLKVSTTGPNGERDRRIFWLYYRVGMAARSIASLPGIELSTKGIETTLLRLSRQIRQQLAVRTQDNRVSRLDEGIRSRESL